MPGLTENQKQLARILRVMAEEIESNRELAERISIRLEGRALPRKYGRGPSIDIFQVFAKEGEKGLFELLDSLKLEELKNIIGRHRLDPSGLSLKWRNKRRLIELIIERTRSRSMHGDVFMKPKESST